MVNWPYWPEATIVAGWQIVAAPIRSVWQSDVALGVLVGVAAYFLIAKSVIFKLQVRRGYG